MKILKKIILLATIIPILVACDNYGQFEEELYQKQVYLISGNDNILNMVCELDSKDSLHNISISCSGTQSLDKDIEVTLETDTILFDKYNYNNFELDYEKYARLVDPKLYRFPTMTANLKASDENNYSLLPFYIDPKNLLSLSVDSTYFIPVAIKEVSEYSIKEEKKNILVRIRLMNKYAETIKSTYYAMKGFSGNSIDDNNPMTINKVVVPFTANSVRTTIGTTSIKDPTEADIARTCIAIHVNEDNTVNVTPFNAEAGTLEVEMLQVSKEEYPNFIYENVYVELPPKFPNGKISQSFLIYYKYRWRDNTDEDWSDWTHSRESLTRVEI